MKPVTCCRYPTDHLQNANKSNIEAIIEYAVEDCVSSKSAVKTTNHGKGSLKIHYLNHLVRWLETLFSDHFRFLLLNLKENLGGKVNRQSKDARHQPRCKGCPLANIVRSYIINQMWST